MSFLEPIYEEIKQLGIRGFVVKKGDVKVEEGKVYLMSNTGDIPGIADLMNHDDHMCKHGCRICDIMGEYAFHGYRFNKVGHLRTFDDLINGRSVSFLFSCLYFVLIFIRI